MGDRVRDKRAIVTGAGSVGPGIGNGKAAAMLFAREGARVMLVDYNLEAAEETKRLIEAEGGTCFTSQADVSSAKDCDRIARECVSEYGGIDILHNNVGIEIPGGILEITEDDWDRTLDVNLKSVFLMCRAVCPADDRSGRRLHRQHLVHQRHPHASRPVRDPTAHRSSAWWPSPARSPSSLLRRASVATPSFPA